LSKGQEAEEVRRGVYRNSHTSEVWNWHIFSARQHRARYMLSSLRPSVTQVDQSKTVMQFSPYSPFLRDKFHPEIPKGSL